MRVIFFAKDRTFKASSTTFPLLVLIFAAICVAQTRVGVAAPTFTLRDQYDKALQLSDLRGSLVVLVDADRTGNQFNGAWVKPLRTRYNTPQLQQIRIVQIAHLSSVPGFLHNYVKGKFISKDSAHPNGPVLLDWEGIVAKAYGFHDEVSNIYLIDRDGILRFTASGKGTTTDLDPLIQLLDKIIARPTNPPNSI
jgi:peroxiredoxin